MIRQAENDTMVDCQISLWFEQSFNQQKLANAEQHFA